MKSKDLSYIALRILSIWFLVKAIHDMTSYLSIKLLYFSNRFPGGLIDILDDPSEIFISVCSMTYILSYFIVGIILWVKTEKLSNCIIPEKSVDESIGNKERKVFSKEFLQDLQGIAFSIFGIVLAMNSFMYISMMVGSMSMFIYQNMWEDFIRMFAVDFSGKGITLILGLLLFLRPHIIVKRIKTLAEEKSDVEQFGQGDQ